MTRHVMMVGSLNRAVAYFKAAHGQGLSVFSFDDADGRAELLWEEKGIDNPAFLSIDPRTACVYANSEVFGWHEGTVTAYRWDAEARRLRYVNKQSSLGSITAHSSLDAEGRHLLVANYGLAPPEEGPDRAVAVYRLEEEGALSVPLSSVSHKGQGPNPERQERSHPHCVIPSPDGRFLVVTDLGLDAVLSYRYADGQVEPRPCARLGVRPGAGPRHIAFHPNGRFAVVINELDSTLLSLAYDASAGSFTTIDGLSALPAGFTGVNHCSDVQIHGSGRFLYGANRGHDSIVVVAIDPASGALRVSGQVPCGGATPRNLAIDPSGRFLLAANQDGDAVAVFAIAPNDGGLTPAGTIATGTPMCIKFLPG